MARDQVLGEDWVGAGEGADHIWAMSSELYWQPAEGVCLFSK